MGEIDPRRVARGSFVDLLLCLLALRAVAWPSPCHERQPSQSRAREEERTRFGHRERKLGRDRRKVEGLEAARSLARRRGEPDAKRCDLRGCQAIEQCLKGCGLSGIQPEDKTLFANTGERRRERHRRGEMSVENVRVAVEN